MEESEGTSWLGIGFLVGALAMGTFSLAMGTFFCVLSEIVVPSDPFADMDKVKVKVEACESIGGEAELSAYAGGVNLDECKLED